MKQIIIKGSNYLKEKSILNIPNRKLTKEYKNNNLNYSLNLIQEDYKNIMKKENVKYLYDEFMNISQNNSNMNEFNISLNYGNLFNKVIKDFEVKYRALFLKKFTKIDWSFNIFNSLIVDKPDKELYFNFLKTDFIECIKYLNKMGIFIDENSIRTSYNEEFLLFLYETFNKIVNKNILTQTLNCDYYNIDTNKNISKEEIEFQKEYKKLYLVNFKILDNEDNDFFKDLFGDNDAFFVSYTDEFIKVYDSIAICLNPHSKYTLFKYNDTYYITGYNFLKKTPVIKDYKVKIINNFFGNELNFKLKNPANNSTIDIIYDENVRNDHSTAVKLICPTLNKNDFKISYENYKLEIPIENYKNINYNDKIYPNLLTPELENDLKDNLINNMFLLKEQQQYDFKITNYIHKITKKRVLLNNQINWGVIYDYDSIIDLKDEIFNSVKIIGDDFYENLYLKDRINQQIENLVNQTVSISYNGDFGIPVPILKLKNSKNKFLIDSEIINNFKSKCNSYDLYTNYENIDIKELLPNDLVNKSIKYKKLNLYFNNDFINLVHLLYFNSQITNNNNNNNENFEIYYNSVDKIHNNFFKQIALLSVFKRDFNVNFKNFKIYPNLIKIEEYDEEVLLNKFNSSNEIVNILDGSVKLNGNRQYSYHPDSLRLLYSMIDSPFNKINTVLLVNRLLDVKKSELNFINKVLYESLLILNSNIELLDNNQDALESSYDIFSYLLNNETNLFLKSIKDNYDTLNYQGVYKILIDYIKFSYYDFYLIPNKNYLYLSHIDKNKNQLREKLFVIKYCFESILYSLYPICPNLSNYYYKGIKYKEVKSTIINEDVLTYDIQTINIKDSILFNFIKDLKIKLLNRLDEILKINRKTTFKTDNYNRFEIVIFNLKEKDENEFLQIFSKFSNLDNILNVSKVNIEKNISKIYKYKKNKFLLEYKNKLDLKIYIIYCGDNNKCDNCFKYRSEDDKKNCLDCKFINNKLLELENN